MEPILVSTATSGMPMTVTDGNLRLVNQYARWNRDNQWFVTERVRRLAREHQC
jgi:hypothetical protein